MLRKYQNELIVLFAVLLLCIAMGFKSYKENRLSVASIETTMLISRMQDIATMKKIWEKNKTVSKKLATLKKSLSKEKIKKFKLDKKKADIILQQLNGSELNRIIGKQIASIPVQITTLSIARSGDKYRLEIQCKW